MVLEIDFFRDYKGHDPNKVRENQQKRFKDLKLVEAVIDQGELKISQFKIKISRNMSYVNWYKC